MEFMEFKYKIGDLVYLKTDVQQEPRLVTGIIIRANDRISYYLSCGKDETHHYDFEISTKKDVLITSNN